MLPTSSDFLRAGSLGSKQCTIMATAAGSTLASELGCLLTSDTTHMRAPWRAEGVDRGLHDSFATHCRKYVGAIFPESNRA